ncbi:MAG: hypothetical protein IPO39_05850 [Bacteroidetes bacterium]|nr:hypothetical protein [Bacteroidota bacterium]
MERLNYCKCSDENDLTRAYLVLLKHSSNVFFTFFEYCRRKHVTTKNELPISIIDYLSEGWNIATQKGNSIISTNFLLSVLITDNEIQQGSIIESSDRIAIYDGIITFGESLTVVIENKPRSSKVWIQQLNPSRHNLSNDTTIYSNPAILEWKEIVKQLSHLISIPIISGYEKLMIDDFLNYVDEYFPFLNPYDKFHECKGNMELLYRRIHNLLKSIAFDESKVSYQKGWGYNIDLPYKQIRKVGLILEKDDKGWWLNLSLFFGNTQSQAISFYNSRPDISTLNKDEWDLYPDFHLSFKNSNLLWLKSKEDPNHYIEFWKNNINEIYQQQRNDIEGYIDWLSNENIIDKSREFEENLKTKFYNSKMQTLNVCPGFGIICTITSAKAETLDKTGELEIYLKKKIFEGLSIIGIEGNEVIKPV